MMRRMQWYQWRKFSILGKDTTFAVICKQILASGIWLHEFFVRHSDGVEAAAEPRGQKRLRHGGVTRFQTRPGMKGLEKLLRPAWDIFVALAASFAALLTPLRLVQILPERAHLFYFDGTLTTIFLLDVGVRFWRYRRGERPGEPLPATEPGAALRYPVPWLVLDLFAAMPWGMAGGNPMFRPARLVKLARVGQLMLEWRQRAVKRSSWLRLAFFAYWIVLSMHWIACGWLALRGVPAAVAPESAYLSALYWTVQTFATVGYGDQPPTDDAQTVYAIVVMI